MEKIELTKEGLIDAFVEVTCCDAMKEIIETDPTVLLLIPIILTETGKVLFGKETQNEQRTVDRDNGSGASV